MPGKNLQVKRRRASSEFNRVCNSLNILIDAQRPNEEVQQNLDELITKFNNLQSAHDEYGETLDDEEQYQEEEAWLSESQMAFIELKMKANDYCSKNQKETVSDKINKPEEADRMRMVDKRDETDEINQTGVINNASEIDEAGVINDLGDVINDLGELDEEEVLDERPRPLKQVQTFKMEKPRLPKFTGNIREYNIFKSDFRHVVEQQYRGREALMILRSCLTGKPLNHIQGIGQDYQAAWDQLDLMYGDPRMVADAIIDDISKFRHLKPGDDNQFCEFVNLVRRSYNTLNEIGRESDMDNSHMLAIIERKLSAEDRRLWFRKQEEEASPTMKTMLKWMETELKARMRSTAPVRNESKFSGVVNHVTNPSVSKEWKCWICKSNSHWTDQCKTLITMSHQKRFQYLKDNHACFSCLKQAGRDHRMNNCRRRKRCTENQFGQQCKYYHHPLLHQEQASTSVGVAFGNTESVLPVLTAEFIGTYGQNKLGNILLDSGAQISIIRQEFANDLRLKGKKMTVKITKVGGEEEEYETQLYQVPIREVNKRKRFNVSAIGLPQISSDVHDVMVSEIVQSLGLKANEINRRSGPVDLLIGIDHGELHAGETKKLGGYIVRRSPLGWVVFGANAERKDVVNTVLHLQVTPKTDLSQFWTTEAMGVTGACDCKPQRMTKTEKEEYDMIWKSCQKVGNQWLVPYPWRKDPNTLPDNKLQAERMLYATERKLARNPEYAAMYSKQMNEMVEMEFSRKLSEKEIILYKGPVHYVSHHAVIRPEKKSTPVRIVFNSSATYQGTCLNDYWHKGPDLLNNLFGVLLRFRENEVAICADISKMFHRILIPESDQHVHRYLWRSSPDQKPDVYVKKVVTFGDKPAPAMAQVALKQTAEEGRAQYPEAAEILDKDVYMDDICTSVKEVVSGRRIVAEINDVLSKGGFKVKGWASNKCLRQGNDQNHESKLLESLSEEKILGVVWDNKQDEFSYCVKINTDLNDVEKQELTKRQVLSEVAKIFDPIGFTAAFIVRAKMGIQHLWQLGLDWDARLPKKESADWIELFREMKTLTKVKLPRCLTPQSAIGQPMLCLFSDASEGAFGACAYLRWRVEDEAERYEARFLTAKSRVAPLKRLTIPRLELQAAVMAARLYETITEETRLNIAETIFMTDSMIVLGWVKGKSREFKPFVSARIGEIQSKCDPSQWIHVPGELNPADDVSRGVSVDKLSERWCNGPTFLTLPVNEWPVTKSADVVEDTTEEKRKGHQIAVIEVKAETIDCERVSCWRKLLRITSYVNRFIHNLKGKHKQKQNKNESRTRNGPLAPEELTEAERYWVKLAQRSLHDRMKKGEFKSLSPFIEAGIIRVGGRTGASKVSYYRKHPALLPQTHYISKLITRQEHESGHCGVAATAAKVRGKYWIIGLHKIAKTVKFRCVVCRKEEHKVESQFMANLPEQRLLPFTPPFHHTSCDYFGPYDVKVGRNKTAKNYGVIFTCLNSRAVHLDLAVDCSTMEFMQVLRRFLALRGNPKVIMSDNGTQFIGAERELREMIKGWDASELKEFCADKMVKWQFTTPSAPHQNGCAEAMVKSVKRALKRAIGIQILTSFELYTCLLEAANLVNQRPIGRIPNDPDDGKYLCPNDLLLGRASSCVPQGPFRETKNPRHRAEFVQRIVDSFWKGWNKDVFPLLVPRKKWNVEKRNVRVDDTVVLSDFNAIRGKWTLGRIIHVYPGIDGKIRNVKVKTANGEFRRPITKIVVIDPAEGYEDTD